MLQLLNKFSTGVDDLVAGRATHDVTKEIVGGARVRYIFQVRWLGLGLGAETQLADSLS